MSKQQRESNGPARQDRAIKEVRTNPAGFFKSVQAGAGGTSTKSSGPVADSR